MRKLAPVGRRVTLTTDPTQDTFDRYRRLLAYADTVGGSLAVNQLRAGWAKVYVFRRSFQQLARFGSAERATRHARRAVWRTCGGNFHRRA